MLGAAKKPQHKRIKHNIVSCFEREPCDGRSTLVPHIHAPSMRGSMASTLEELTHKQLWIRGHFAHMTPLHPLEMTGHTSLVLLSVRLFSLGVLPLGLAAAVL